MIIDEQTLEKVAEFLNFLSAKITKSLESGDTENILVELEEIIS